MAKVIEPNCAWCLRMQRMMDQAQDIDEVIQTAYAAAWLIKELAKRNIVFRVIPLGAGVRRIITNTDICPCCKRQIP